MLDHFRMFAHYNQWANQILFAAAAGLTAHQYYEDKGVFFKSLHGTLNHLLVGDLIWMQRFTGEGPQLKALDVILFDELDPLARARGELDQRIIDYIDHLSEAALGSTISYRAITKPENVVQFLSPALAHFFNHQTHHRGQAHCLLTMHTGDAPALDLVYYQREG